MNNYYELLVNSYDYNRLFTFSIANVKGKGWLDLKLEKIDDTTNTGFQTIHFSPEMIGNSTYFGNYWKARKNPLGVRLYKPFGGDNDIYLDEVI